jgi:hypothetical protein
MGMVDNIKNNIVFEIQEKIVERLAKVNVYLDPTTQPLQVGRFYV